MGLTLTQRPVDMDVIKQEIADAAAVGENARQMVFKRDPVLNSLKDVADKFATEIARADEIHADIRSIAEAARDRAMTPGPAGPQGLRGPSGMDGVQGQPGPAGPAGPAGRDGVDGKAGAAGKDGAAGPAGTANLSVGARPVGALLLGASTPTTVPLSRAMPDTNYRPEVAHSAIVNLAAGMLEVTGKTTTTVTVKVTAVGIALAAGTLIVVAV